MASFRSCIDSQRLRSSNSDITVKSSCLAAAAAAATTDAAGAGAIPT